LKRGRVEALQAHLLTSPRKKKNPGSTWKKEVLRDPGKKNGLREKKTTPEGETRSSPEGKKRNEKVDGDCGRKEARVGRSKVGERGE